MKRPKHLAVDKTPLTSVVKHVALKLVKEKYIADFVLQIAPTCPFIKISTIKQIIKLLKKGNECVVTLKKIEHEHPYRAKKLNEKNWVFKSFLKNINVEKFISRQDLPILYCTSGGIYARSFQLLRKFNEKDFNLGKKPIGVVVDDRHTVSVRGHDQVFPIRRTDIPDHAAFVRPCAQFGQRLTLGQRHEAVVFAEFHSFEASPLGDFIHTVIPIRD